MYKNILVKFLVITLKLSFHLAELEFAARQMKYTYIFIKHIIY
jgi:hypothetical protein